jgi:hypothetical protein
MVNTRRRREATMSRDDVWNRYVEAMALLAKAQAQTAGIRGALADAEADEAELRRIVEDARDSLDNLARREAGGAWVSLDEWLARRTEVTSPQAALRAVTEARENGTLAAEATN